MILHIDTFVVWSLSEWVRSQGLAPTEKAIIGLQSVGGLYKPIT